MTRRTLRRIKNSAFLALSMIATLVGLACLAALLWTLISHGVAGLSWTLFTQMTPPPGSGGGLLNALYGSAVMTLLGILIGSPIGVLAGTYLAEYGHDSKLSAAVRFINDVLLSAPSIIIGLFIYEIVVVRMGHFSAVAGALSLAVLAIPITLRTTEDMLNLVPPGMKDSSAALGAYPWRTTLSILYPAARSGIVTGLLLAVARISGETAPLLFTALNNQLLGPTFRVHALGQATNIRFIGLYRAFKRFFLIVAHSFANPMQHKPRGLLRDLKSPCDLIGRDTVTVARD